MVINASACPRAGNELGETVAACKTRDVAIFQTESMSKAF